MNDTIKTSMAFKPNNQFSLTHRDYGIVVYGEITEESLADFVEANAVKILEIINRKQKA